MSEPMEDLIIERCPQCGMELNVTSLEPFERANCVCGAEMRVKVRFGNYELRRRYAVGGMSVVFVAWDTTLNREVAVKILNAEYSVDERRVQQFENEARLTAAVHNPHVVQIYTVGRAYGRFYLVMELLEGRSFERVMLERGALPEAEVLEIGKQVLVGLRAANDAGVIHRDVKPGNVLIEPNGLVKLVDFGLALITQGGKAQAEEIWATPYYVPPEVLDRKVEDFRSDLYALGATLYHALIGHPPFDAKSTSTSSLKELKKNLPKVHKAASWLKPATCEAVDQLMAFESKNRPSSYREAIGLVDRALSETSDGVATPIHGAARARRRGRSRTLLLQGAAAVAALGAAGLVSSQIFGKKEPDANNSVPVVDSPGVVSVQPQSGKSDIERLAQTWQQARAAVGQRDFKLAALEFQKIVDDESVPEPTRSWAQLEHILAHLLNGQPGVARQAADQMKRRLKRVEPVNTVTKGLHEISKNLSMLRPVADSHFEQIPGNVVEWVSGLALAAKNWEHGLITQTVPFLRKVQQVDLTAEYPWFATYQQVVEDYLHDAAVLHDFAALPDPGDEKAAQAQIMELNDRLSQLKTQGRARFNVRARQSWLARVRKGFENGPATPTTVTWLQLDEQLRQSARQADFTAISERLAEQPEVGTSEARQAWLYLGKQAETFKQQAEALKNVPLELHLDTGPGAVITAVSITTEGAVDKDGTVYPWRDLDASSLIKKHDTLKQTAPPGDKATYREAAIAFGYLTDLRAYAEFEAETFANENADFAARWKSAMKGLRAK